MTDDMKQQLLDVLVDANEYMSPLALASKVCGKDGKAKDVNRALYQLQSEGKIKKKSEPNGAKPLWKVKQKMRSRPRGQERKQNSEGEESKEMEE